MTKGNLISILILMMKKEKKLLSYAEAIEQCGSEYQLTKAVSDGLLIREESGIYSTEPTVSELAIVMKKYPKAILAGEYAFFIHGLTNLIPEKYDLATPSKSDHSHGSLHRRGSPSG